MTTTPNRRRINERLARAAMLGLFALAAALYPGREARAQWVTTGNDIGNTNPGNVGIGTTTPENVEGWNKVLDVFGSPHAKFSIRTTAIDARVVAHDYGSWGAPAGMIVGTRTNHPLSFASGGLFRMTIGTNGNVGIGTNTPASPLTIQSDTNVAPLFVTGVNANVVGIGVANVQAGSKGWGVQVTGSGNSYGAASGSLVMRQTSDNINAMVFSPAGHVGIGTASPTENLHVAGNSKITGNLVVGGNINAKYQDVAEWVPTLQAMPAGTVVILDVERDNHVTASTRSYDTRVAGVVSEKPGLSLGEAGEGKALVATTGRVKVRVDATRAPIKIGDLLVTGETPGVAMRSQPVELGGVQLHRPGTLIGKALQSLDKGTGEILVLLSLQ